MDKGRLQITLLQDYVTIPSNVASAKIYLLLLTIASTYLYANIRHYLRHGTQSPDN